jgi:thiosulfate/3-mercaptopyruvate sulfurtransferase
LTVSLLTISVSLIIAASASPPESKGHTIPNQTETQLLETVEQAQDHIDPEELADRILQRQSDLLVVDIRPSDEYMQYHLPTAQNIAMKDLHTALMPYKNNGMVVLCSNGMTHPVQARDSLYRSGFKNVYILTDGLNGFIEKCLTPVSLRKEPIDLNTANKINDWRKFFLGNVITQASASQITSTVPPLVDAEWLDRQLLHPATKIIDLRPQPEYNTSHIPNSFALNIENLRTNIKGVGSMLQPSAMLAQHLSFLGIQPTDVVVIIYGDKPHDATLLAIALERLGHDRYTILNGGFAAWKSANKSLAGELTQASVSNSPVRIQHDSFTADYLTVLNYVQNKKGIILRC